MTTREARGLAAADEEEQSIASYLQRNPDFFERHQAVLARLRLPRSEEHTSELQSQSNLVCRLLLEKKKNTEGIRVHAGSRTERDGVRLEGSNSRISGVICCVQ